MKELAFSIPNRVLRERVSFLVGGVTVVANLFRPANPGGLLPAVVFGGPLSGVKEQSTGAYSAELASHGFACLSMDHRYFGESEGEPRQYENYKTKIEDLDAATNWLINQEGIDSSRVGACGVCLGAAYCASMALANDKVKAVGFVVGLFPTGGTPSERGIAARELYEKTGEVKMIKAASVTEDAAMPMQIAVDYYCNPQRAMVQNYCNEVALMFEERWQEYNAMAVAASFTKPICMIHGQQSFAMKSGTAFLERAASQCKTMHWIDSLPHTAFYDNPEAICEIGEMLAAHFNANL